MTEQEWWNNLVNTRKLEYPGLIKVKKTLSDKLYPDKAHFIYELLQNAEDVQATNVSFILEEDKLIVKHNGRNFSQKDVTAITDVDESTKSSDNEKIGKFGLGFKSVFNYTNKPKIYSGNFAFEINWIIPEKIAPIALGENETVLIFPFDKEDKPPLVAFKEILKGIKDIDDNTLLFLNHIDTITCEFDSQSFIITRMSKSEYEIEISNTLKNTNSRWLRFKKYLSDMPKLYIAIAYSIEENEKTKKDKIIPIDGQVSIFFPADKETSKLKFHIHAPFNSGVARDSLTNDDDVNEQLINLIAETLIESFDYIKTSGLLTISFLEVLPNKEDNLQTYYPPISNKCIEAFQKQPYMLTESGEYQPSDVCYRGSANLKKLISDQDLRILTGRTNVYWSKNALQNSRADDFISSLEINKFNEEDFDEKLLKISSMYGNADSRNDYKEEFEQINTLFSSKSDEWYLKFYVFLKEYKESVWIDKYSLKFFIRLQNGQLNIDCKDCFFDSGLQSDEFLYVKSETYSSSKKESDNENAKSFLESLGVKEVGEKEKIELILNDYSDGKFPTFEEHVKHIDVFLDYFTRTDDNTIFQDKSFLLATNTENKKTSIQESKNIMMDTPFCQTGLSVVAEYLLYKRYKDKFHDSNFENFIKFCQSIGVRYKLEVKEIPLRSQHPKYYSLYKYGERLTNGKLSQDWTIEGIEKLLSKPTISISLLIWDTVRNSQDCLNARYRPNAQKEIKYEDSTLICFLKESLWIPDKNGNFYMPADINQEQLPKEFLYDDRNGWLTAIGFGENIRKNQQEYKEKEKIAKEITGGHDLEDIEALKEIPPEELKAFLAQQQNKNIPENSIEKKPLDVIGAIQKHTKNINHADAEIDPAIVKNNEAYLDTLRKQHKHTIQKSTIAKSRSYSAKIKDGRDETVIFLKNQYKGHCQICGFTFTKTDGQNNFEMFDWGASKITKVKSNLALPASSLCLCPNCHANIKWGSFHPDFLDNLNTKDLSKYTFEEFCEVTKTRIEHAEIPECYSFIEIDMYKIPIHLNQEKRFIFYTEEHFLHFFGLACLAKKDG